MIVDNIEDGLASRYDLKSLVLWWKASYKSRLVDLKMWNLSRQNSGGSFHLFTKGHEVIGALFGSLLKAKQDWLIPYYRDRASVIALGVPLDQIIAGAIARQTDDHSSGRMMPDHFASHLWRLPCRSSCVGPQFHHAVGVGMAIVKEESDHVVYVSGGDGSTSQGDFYEALNMASIHSLPILFVIHNNHLAISVSLEEQSAGKKPGSIAAVFPNIDYVTVDSSDPFTMYQKAEYAIAKARAGGGATLFVIDVPRLGAHSSSDDPLKYRTEEEIERERLKDPLPALERLLTEMGFSSEERSLLEMEIKEQVDQAAFDAERRPHPEHASAFSHIFVPSIPAEIKKLPEEGESKVMVDALNEALIEEMERDDKVVVYGQDVAKGKGGVFGVTRGLTARFGEKRCFNTPLAESLILGSALGMAAAGYKPVVEIQFADYIWTGINQLFNEIASYYYRSNGRCALPLVVRMPCGGYIQGGPYHSQSIEAFLSHMTGLKVVFPSNSYHAKALLKSAIQDPGPVVFLEHKALYRQRAFSARPLGDKNHTYPFGKAVIWVEGESLTLVTWGALVGHCVEIAHKMAKKGIFVEVIDLLTMVPCDLQSVMDSVKKTGKLLIIQESSLFCGFGAEIAATLCENLFHMLDAPIMRIGSTQTIIPYAKALEEHVLPSKEGIEQAILQLHQK